MRAIWLLAWLSMIGGCATIDEAAAPVRQIAWSPHSHELRSGETIEAQIGSLEVPATRRGAGQSTLTIRFVRLPAHPGASGPPIIYLAGGPGSSGIEAGQGDRYRMFDRLRRLGDVILLDQRGTGLSSAPPACSQPWMFPADEVATEEAIRPSFEAGLRACAAEWREAGVPLDAFNTVDNAADVADLVRALGVRKARLVGISYGTFLGFAVLRDHADLIDRAVFAGTEGPDHTVKLPTSADAALKALSDEFAEESPAAAGERLETRVRRLFDKLAAGPIFVEQNGPRVAVSLFDAQFAIAFMMATSENATRLPALLASTEKGDFRPIASLVERLRGFYGAYPAMSYATDAASDSSPLRKRAAQASADVSNFGNSVNFPNADIRGALGVEAIPERYLSPIRSDVPAYFISGSFDWRTPPAQAEEIRRGFRESGHLVLDGAGHDNDLFLSSPIILDRIEQFFSGLPVADETIDVDLLASR